jgi:hypothetical protein
MQDLKTSAVVGWVFLSDLPAGFMEALRSAPARSGAEVDASIVARELAITPVLLTAVG